MYRKIIKNDIKNSKLITTTITAFILLAAMLTSLVAILIIDLVGAIDHSMLRAKSPHFMQMHSGDINIKRLENFANTQGNVDSFQIQGFLNIGGEKIIIEGNSLAGSIQDNGFATQSDSFDFLLDLKGNIIHPVEGEIYAPIYYMKENQIKVGDEVKIDGNTFTVAGFIRDTMMNPAMISSKRFLVSDQDLKKIENFGRLEYLIEFRLKNSSDLSDFEADYIKAGLESNGPPAITYPLFKLANGISDGIMIGVLILISMLVIAVTFLCIRFTLFTKIDDDYKEIGVLKAVGLRVSNIKKLYLAKYGAITVVACILGFLLSLIIQRPLSENIRLYMGETDSHFLSLLGGIVGATIIFLVIMLYVNGVLSRFKKISAAQAIRFGAPQEKSKSTKKFCLDKNHLFSCNVFLGIKDVIARKKIYITMLLVLVISFFIMIVPQNIYNTISSRSFMTYMGIGNCYMRMDIQQTDHIAKKTAEITKVMEQDDSISHFTVLTSMMFDINMDDSSTQRLKVELGDHLAFPIVYAKGKAPEKDTEIAISILNADDLEKKIGDKINLVIDGKVRSLTVCGIYSDITNGGKTAKATFEAKQQEVLWSIIPVKFYDNRVTDSKVSEYKDRFSFAKISNMDDFIHQSFGTMVTAIQKASYASIATAVFLVILVTLLFMKMLVTKDRYSISILKSLGFTVANIRRQYVTRSIIVLILGVIVGTVLSNTLGELVGVAVISSFGASSFHFEINSLFAYLFSPIVIATCVYIATVVGISDIATLKISDHIKE